MKKIIMSVIALAVISMTIGFVGCNKEKENINENQSQNENVERMPIAVKDLKNGKFDYLVSADDIQSALNKNIPQDYVSRNGEKYIVESFEIKEDMLNTPLSLILVYLDTETETSSTVWLTNDFMTTVLTADYESFYLNENLYAGDFSFASKQGDDIYVTTMKNGEIVSNEKWDDNSKASGLPAGWFVKCTGYNCKSGYCQPQEKKGIYYCSPCDKTDEEHRCEQKSVNPIDEFLQILFPRFSGFVI